MRWVFLGFGIVALGAGVFVGLRSLGSDANRWVSPVEAHNEAIELVSMDDRAYPVLAKFAARAEVGETQAEFGDVGFGDEGWDKVIAWVELPETQRAIGLLEEAAGRSVLGVPMLDSEDSIWVDAMAEVGLWLEEPMVDEDSTAPLMLNAILPMPGVIVRAGVYLRADAMAAVEGGDRERFVRDVQTWARIAMFADEPELIIGQMVQAIEVGKITRLISSVLVEHSEFLDEVAAEEIEIVLDDVSNHQVFVVDAQLEIIIFEDVLRRMVDDRGDFDWVRSQAFTAALDDDTLTPPQPSSAKFESMSPELLAPYARVKRRYERAAESTAIPWHPIRACNQEDNDVNGFDSRIVAIAEIVFPVLSVNEEKLVRAMSMFRTKHQEFIGVRVALAAHRHQLRHSEPAAGLMKIDADLLGFEPTDGFTGEAVQYRWVNGEALVYALGADGDDDGGVAVVRPEDVEGYLVSDEYLEAKWDGDMVLFPAGD